MEISSKNLHSQTLQPRELKFWDMVHLPPPAMCHMSCVTFHMSYVPCHMSCVKKKKKNAMWWSFLVEGLLPMWPTPSSLERLSLPSQRGKILCVFFGTEGVIGPLGSTHLATTPNPIFIYWVFFWIREGRPVRVTSARRKNSILVFFFKKEKQDHIVSTRHYVLLD